MKLSSFKQLLDQQNMITIKLPNGQFIPSHFHITEVGLLTKHFIDCGGTVRQENHISLQLWLDDNDMEHRLTVDKLLKIISLSEDKIGFGDHEILVEYQAGTIGKYGIAFDGESFVLTSKQTACLASDQCGVPAEKKKITLVELSNQTTNTCTPGGGCC